MKKKPLRHLDFQLGTVFIFDSVSVPVAFGIKRSRSQDYEVQKCIVCIMNMPHRMCHSLRCPLGGRKSIWPVKNLSDEMLAWLSVWGEVQMTCIWSS